MTRKFFRIDWSCWIAMVRIPVHLGFYMLLVVVALTTTSTSLALRSIGMRTIAIQRAGNVTFRGPVDALASSRLRLSDSRGPPDFENPSLIPALCVVAFQDVHFRGVTMLVRP
jgi:hypothetical protein